MRTKRALFVCLVVLVPIVSSPKVGAISIDDHPKLQEVASRLQDKSIYTKAELELIFKKAKIQQSVLDSMMNPAEYKFTWGKYRALFLKPDRIERAVQFWQTHQQALERAEQEYGVPVDIILAIIGVESKYGEYKGKDKVLDSLVTLSTGFPRRSTFFSSELEHFLILCKENDLDASSVLGSYAGAMGYPQFISSSYRNYAVDFSGDGKTDLIEQPVDAIGSIANYFVKNGWKPGQPVTSQAISSVPKAVQALNTRKRKVIHSAQKLRALGANLEESIDDATLLNVLQLNANEHVPREQSKTSYLVRAGDTACEIAEKFSVSCAELFRLNKLNSKGKIFRGQKLKLPQGVSDKATTSKNKESNNTKKAASKWQVEGSESANENANESVLTNKDDSIYSERFVYFYTHHNFYVITRYNQSVLYAMAVHDLSQAIANAREAQ